MRNRLKNPGTERPESSTSAQKTKMVQVAMAADSQLLEGRNGHHFFTRFTKLPCEDNIPASAVIRPFESFFFFFESFCLADFPFAAIPRPSFSRILSSSGFREDFGSRLLNTYLLRICSSDVCTMVLGSFNTNYIIFRNVEIFKFFFCSKKKIWEIKYWIFKNILYVNFKFSKMNSIFNKHMSN
jgi:hypothetical protein